MKINYDESKHRIQNNWEDISKLIAIEEDILNRLKSLEDSILLLWKEFTKK